MGSPVKVALTKGTLLVPPTYFALAHAAAMPDLSWQAFTLAARVRDPRVVVPIREASPGALSSSRAIRLVSEARGLGAMRRAITQGEPEVIHQHQATWSLPAVGAARDTGAPLVVTVHGADAYRRLGRGPGAAWNDLNRRAAFGGAHRLLAVSRYLADVALASGAQRRRLRVHYQGVDTAWWHPGTGACDRGAGGAPGVPIVLFVGALSHLKGVDDLVEASVRLHDAHPHSLVLVGEGPLSSTLVSRAPAHVTVTGQLSREEVRDWMRRSHVLVLPTKPTRGRAEAAGLVLLEAQACGVPALAYATGGTPEMVAPGASVLTPGRTSTHLARTLGEALTWGDAERAERGLACRRWVEENRSLATSADQLRAVYREVSR